MRVWSLFGLYELLTTALSFGYKRRNPISVSDAKRWGAREDLVAYAPDPEMVGVPLAPEVTETRDSGLWGALLSVCVSLQVVFVLSGTSLMTQEGRGASFQFQVEKS